MLLERIKLSLRIMSNDFDLEIDSLMQAAIQDLKDAGVKYDESNERHILAVIAYIRLNFGTVENKNFNMYTRAYNNMLKTLAIQYPAEV